MTRINSVLGPLDTAELGFTLMHEHLVGTLTGIFPSYPELLGERLMERIVAGLARAKKEGIDTIVDASLFDNGREPNLMAEASRRSGVNIIATTGWFHEPNAYIGTFSPDVFAGLFVREIREGIAGTGVRPGLLKAANDIAGVTRAGEVMLRAVARAHLQTGVPIILHSYAPGEVGRQQLAVLKDEGVNLKRVKVDHSLDTTDTGYLTWLLEQGCYLGMERCPNVTIDIRDRAKTMKALIDAGWAHRLCPSHDYILIRDAAGLPPHIEKFFDTNPHGYLYVKKVLFPMLQEMGVPEATLDGLCRDNPRSFFEGV